MSQRSQKLSQLAYFLPSTDKYSEVLPLTNFEYTPTFTTLNFKANEYSKSIVKEIHNPY